MSPPRYLPIPLDTAEVQRLSAEHGERVDNNGFVLTPSDLDRIPCPGEPDTEGEHHPKCECLGSGFLLPKRVVVDLVEVADHSLTALETALEEREAAEDDGNTVTERTLQPGFAVDRSGGGGSARRKTPLSPARMALEKPPSAEDGRLESKGPQRKGRPPRFDQTRDVRVSVSVAPETENILAANGVDLAEIAEKLRHDPEFSAVLEPLRAAKKGEEAGLTREIARMEKREKDSKKE